MMAARESFGEFITRILHEKKLSLSDVERRTKGAISDSYLSYIIQEKGGNLTVRKLKVLAQGLGEPEVVIFEAASGISLIEATGPGASEFAHIMAKYNLLTDRDKMELRPTLQLLFREIERRLRDKDHEQNASQEPAS
jgi:transcriptional regulator with XRE-family HTH domain